MAGQDEDRHNGGRLEVDLVGAGALGEPLEVHLHAGHAGVADEQCPQRPDVRRADSDAHECVHRDGAVAGIGPRGPVEWPGAPGHDRCGEDERDPLPVVELKGRNHRQKQDRQGQDGRDPEPAEQRRGIVVHRVARRRSGRVAGLLDRRDQVIDTDRLVGVDRGLLGRVVHRGVDAVELVELLLDPHGARGARHTADVELDGVDLRGGHTSGRSPGRARA